MQRRGRRASNLLSDPTSPCFLQRRRFKASRLTRPPRNAQNSLSPTYDSISLQFDHTITHSQTHSSHLAMNALCRAIPTRNLSSSATRLQRSVAVNINSISRRYHQARHRSSSLHLGSTGPAAFITSSGCRSVLARRSLHISAGEFAFGLPRQLGRLIW